MERMLYPNDSTDKKDALKLAVPVGTSLTYHQGRNNILKRKEIGAREKSFKP